MPETMRLMSFTDNTDSACESEAVSELCLSVSVLFNFRCSHTCRFFTQSKPTSLTGAFVGAWCLKIRCFCREESAKQQTMYEFACESDL